MPTPRQSAEAAGWDDEGLRAFVRSLPKAELHVHLEGSLSPVMAMELARRHGIALPGADRGEAGLRAHYSFRTFRDFIDLYLALAACFVEPEDLADALDDLACRHQEEGVVHAEVTFTPTLHLRRGVAPEILRDGLVEGRRRARARGVETRFVFDVVRHLPDTGEPTLAFALAMAATDPGCVAGLGLAGPERAGDVAVHAELFRRARRDGMVALPHAGEQAGASNVRDAVELLGAVRIGHGVRCVEDPDLVELLQRRGVVLEVCPSSNVALGVCPKLADHPLPHLLAAGLRVTLGSDDPPLFGTSLLEEYVRCAHAFGWDGEQLRALAAASLAARSPIRS